MTPLDIALAALLGPLRPVRAETVALADAVGAVLAEPILSPAALPRRAVALRPGWAVSAIETVGAAAYAPVILSAVPVQVRVGDALPPGADAVVPPDAVTVGAVAEAMVEAIPGEGARRAGEDAAAGGVLRAAGARVRAFDVALAAAAGVSDCTVRRVRIALVADSAADAARAMVEATARNIGAALAATPTRQASAADLVEVNADVIAFVGSDEVGAAALTERGRSIAPALGLRPGEGTACGLLDEHIPVVLVPARPEAAFAASRCVLRPCLERLTGVAADAADFVAPLTRKIASSVGVAEIALLRAAPGGLEPLAVADLTLAALSAADAWLLVPADREGYAAGEVVDAFAV